MQKTKLIGKVYIFVLFIIIFFSFIFIKAVDSIFVHAIYLSIFPNVCGRVKVNRFNINLLSEKGKNLICSLYVGVM